MMNSFLRSTSISPAPSSRQRLIFARLAFATFACGFLGMLRLAIAVYNHALPAWLGGLGVVVIAGIFWVIELMQHHYYYRTRHQIAYAPSPRI